MDLQDIAAHIGQRFEETDQARDRSVISARKVIKNCSLAIRDTHRGQREEAEGLMSEAQRLLLEAAEPLRLYPDVYYSGFLQDAEKEFAEAKITFSVINGCALPTPEDLGVDFAPYLNGLAEAVGELRRQTLDLLRRGEMQRAEELLSVMDDIYYVLISMDFPDAITRGLRRNTDIARGCLEKTRGDLTHHAAGQEIRSRFALAPSPLS